MRVRPPTRRRSWHAAVALLALIAVGCTASGAPEHDNGPSTSDTTGATEPDAAAGGEVVWLLESGWGGVYNRMRIEGASLFLGQALAGIEPVSGWFDPDGVWTWNLDLFAEPPQVVATAPLTLQYRLRPEAAWNDGTPIGVDDFRFAWHHNSGREDHCTACDAADAGGWANLESIEVGADEHTVVVTYADGSADPEWYVRFGPSSYPAHVAEDAGFDWTTPDGMAGASEYFRDTVPTWSGGPYVIDELIPDERVVLVPNEAWYGVNAPQLDRVVKEVVPQPGDWPTAVANGELDGGAVQFFDPDVINRLQALDDVEVTLGSAGGWEHVDLNLRSPALGDPALRRAILMALDTLDARDRIYGDFAPPLRTNHVFSATSPHHADLLTASGQGSGDADAARQILAEAGYDGAASGERLARDGEQVPELRFAYLSNNAARKTYVELAQSYLAAIGITVVPVAVPGSDFGRTLGTGDFDLVILGFGSGPVFTHTLPQFFASDSPANFAGIDSAEIDALATSALNQTDIAVSASLANDIVGLVIEEAAILPLWENPGYLFVRSGLRNVHDNSNADVRAMYNLGDWALAADG